MYVSVPVTLKEAGLTKLFEMAKFRPFLILLDLLGSIVIIREDVLSAEFLILMSFVFDIPIGFVIVALMLDVALFELF